MSKSKLSFRKFADVSTAHIQDGDSAKLAAIADRYDAGGPLSELGCPIVYQYEEGFFIYCGGDDKEYWKKFEEDGLSIDFLNLVSEANKEGMAYLQLDRDGEEYDHLPKYACY